MSEQRSKKRIAVIIILAFVLPILVLLAVMAICGVIPFGSKSTLVWDSLLQHKDYYGYLWDVFHGKASIEYSAWKSLGGRMIGLIGFYISSPLNIFLVFFSKAHIPYFMVFMIILRIGLCGITGYIYIHNRFRISAKSSLVLSTLYALMEYNVYNCRNVMWLDGVIILPLIALGVWKCINEKRTGLLFGSVFMAILCNWYTGYMVCLMSGILFIVEYLNAYDYKIKDALKNAGLDASKHMIAVTSETSPLAKSDDYLAAFFMDDYIGGRFSSTSAVGGAVLSLAFGPEVFARFLEGAAAEDKLSANEDVLKNPEMLDALIGVYERNVLGYPCTAVLPYSQALNRFPAHLQQLDMESNGKSVNRFGEPVSYPTGPVIFGEPGTNGQHSFYQLLHQGTDIVPLQFVGFKNNQIGTDVVIQDSTSQQKLCANVAAQIVAFACGKSDENRNKNFEGGRPSSIIIGDQVNPGSLGALLAHFENKIMFQGFLWNVNSFDQEGVQLGKVLAKRVLAHETDGALKVFSDLLNI